MPGELPQDAYRGKASFPNTPQDDFPGTPPFKGIPAKFQPSRRDNFYRGMLMKCWIGTVHLGGKTDYAQEEVHIGGKPLTSVSGMYRKPDASTQTQPLYPPPERIPSVPTYDTVSSGYWTGYPDTITQASIQNAKAFEKAGISRTLETRVIQASFRQIDYIPRKKGGCHWSGLSYAYNAQDEAKAFGQAGCQDEVPGYPAVVRLESPFSRTLDPDTLCYIQRKADVGVYTGMTAMIGHKEYTIKQGAANIYTVSHVASDMTGPNGDPVDRKVPRSYSTEDAGMAYNTGLRGPDNTYGFFKDGVGLSGQPYLIYSQLELVARRGAKVNVGETITVRIPSHAMIMPPVNDALGHAVTPANSKDTLAGKITISHALVVPLSSACSIVSVYGAVSGCQYDNERGGSFDLLLSTQWPYAYDAKGNKNDLNGYAMTVFGAQSTVIKTMADKYSQDLPVRPLEGVLASSEPEPPPGGTDGANNGTNSTDEGSDAGQGVASVTNSTVWDEPEPGYNEYLDILYGSHSANYSTPGTRRRRREFYRHAGSASVLDPSISTSPMGRLQADSGTGTDALSNTHIALTFTVAKELDALYLTGGTARGSWLPKLPNAPITLTDAGCGSTGSSYLGSVTLPYAVCLSLGGSLAHNQFLTRTDLQEFNVDADRESPRQNQNGIIIAGVQSITGGVGNEVTPVMPGRVCSYMPVCTYVCMFVCMKLTSWSRVGYVVTCLYVLTYVCLYA
jgi:hypothetical protein